MIAQPINSHAIKFICSAVCIVSPDFCLPFSKRQATDSGKIKFRSCNPGARNSIIHRPQRLPPSKIRRDIVASQALIQSKGGLARAPNFPPEAAFLHCNVPRHRVIRFYSSKQKHPGQGLVLGLIFCTHGARQADDPCQVFCAAVRLLVYQHASKDNVRSEVRTDHFRHPVVDFGFVWRGELRSRVTGPIFSSRFEISTLPCCAVCALRWAEKWGL
jgi:hypothetical protein